MPPVNPSAQQLRQRREKLQLGLVEKLKEMCGKKEVTVGREEEQFINQEVAKLLKTGKVQEADLVRLEKQVRSMQRKPAPLQQRTQTQDNAPAATQAHHKDDLSPVSHRTNTSYMGDEWAALQQLEREEFEARARREREEAAQKRDMIRKALDEQTRQQKEAVARAKREELEYAKLEAERLKQWKETEKRKEQAILEKNLREKQIRDKQLQELHEKRERERRERQEEEARAMEQARARLEADKQRETERRREEQKEYTRVLADNERLRELKKQQKKQQVLEDIAFQQRYNELQDKQEADRQAHLRELAEKQRRKYEIGLQRQKTIDQKAQEDQMRAEREQQQRDMQERHDEEMRKAKLRNDREEMKAILQRQLQEKDILRKKQQQEMKEYAARIQREAMEFEQRELEKKHQSREQVLKHREELESQIRENAVRRQYETYVMTDIERQMNAQLLKKAAERVVSPAPSSTKGNRSTMHSRMSGSGAPW